jgi:uncharacterized protein YfiM (DUF2279 family)
MHGLIFLFSLHLGTPSGDRWFAPDKAKHFFTAALVQSASFSAFRATGLARTPSLVGATVVTSVVSVGKELYDRTSGGDPSFKDLAWDGAGLAAATALLHRTAP